MAEMNNEAWAHLGLGLGWVDDGRACMYDDKKYVEIDSIGLRYCYHWFKVRVPKIATTKK